MTLFRLGGLGAVPSFVALAVTAALVEGPETTPESAFVSALLVGLAGNSLARRRFVSPPARRARRSLGE